MLCPALTIPTVRTIKTVVLMAFAGIIVILPARAITNVLVWRFAAVATVLIHVFGRQEALQAL